LWILLTLFSAWSWATSDFFSKRLLSRGEAEELFLLGFRFWASLPLLLPILLLIEIPKLDATFFKLNLVWIPVEALASFLYIRAIRISPLSLTLPLLSLTPLFLLLTARLIIGEAPSLVGVFGILLIVLGSYTLYYDPQIEGFFSPFKRFFKEKGAILMLIVAFLYSLTSVFGKIFIIHSSPLFFTAYFPVVMALIFSPVTLPKRRWPRIRKRKDLALAGLFFALMILFHMLALARAKVAYMIAIKRLSGVFGVIYGGSLLGEERMNWRLIGSTLMVVGAILVSLG
jgi:uncharacterized membrane protein